MRRACFSSGATTVPTASIMPRTATTAARDALSTWKKSGEPASFSNASYVSRRLKQKRGAVRVSKKSVKKDLETSILYQAHRDLRSRFERRAQAVSGFSIVWEGDLADLGSKSIPYRVWGGGKNRYFLLLVDCFSRRLFLKSLKSKTGAEVARKFSQILSSLEPPYKPPETLETDAGK